MRILDWDTLDARGSGAPRWRGRSSQLACAGARQCARRVDRRACAPRAMRHCARYTRRFDARRAGRARRQLARSSRAARGRLQRRQIAALERAIANVERFHRRPAAASRLRSRRRARRALRAGRPPDRARWACTCRRVPRRCPPPSSCWRCRRASPAVPRACCARRPQRDGSANPAVLVARRAVRHRYGLQGRRRAGHRRAGLRHESIPKVDKIFGPGNAWVTAAKQLVATIRPAPPAICPPAHRRCW